MKSDVDAKQEALASAKKNAEDAKAKADNAKKDAAAAQVAVDDAQAKADAAKKAADEAAAKQQEAENQRDDAQQAVTQAEGALQAAKGRLDEACGPVENDPAVKVAQQKLDEAHDRVAEVVKTVDTAQKNAKQALNDEQQGTAGFFRWLGAEKNDPDATRAYELLTRGIYTDTRGNSHDVTSVTDQYTDEHGAFFAKTDLNGTGDATTLKNLKATLPHIDRGNELRRNDDIFTGRTDLKINSLLMAGSQLQTNASNSLIGHRAEVIKAENLAWGHSDPYNGWYTKEKNLYKQEPIGHKSGTGHYKNLMNDTYGFTGFAVVDKPGTLHGIAHGQVFDYNFHFYTDPEAPSYTTAEYSELISEFEKYLDNSKKELHDAQNAENEAVSNVEQAYEALQDAKAAANAACVNAAEQRAQAEENLDAANKTLNELTAQAEAAKQAAKDASQKSDDAQKALEAAQADKAEKDAAVTAAEEEAEKANNAVDAAQSALEEAQAALAAATTELNDLREKAEATRKKADEAADAVADAKTALAEAEGAAEAAARAVKDAEEALQAATEALEAAEAARDELVAPAQAYEDALAKVKESKEAVRKAQAALDAATAPSEPGESGSVLKPKNPKDSANKANGGKSLASTGTATTSLALTVLALAAAGTAMVRVRRMKG